MARNDVTHEVVKNALIKDGWVITHDPLRLKFEERTVEVDLAAERMIAAEKAGLKIAVEIKSFLGDSVIYEFHGALGQFLNYRTILETEDLDYILYLAVPKEVYNTFFQWKLTQKIVHQHQLKLIVYDTYSEVLVKWIN